MTNDILLNSWHTPWNLQQEITTTRTKCQHTMDGRIKDRLSLCPWWHCWTTELACTAFFHISFVVIKCLLLKLCLLRFFLAAKDIPNWSDVSNQTPSFPSPLLSCSSSYWHPPSCPSQNLGDLSQLLSLVHAPSFDMGTVFCSSFYLQSLVQCLIHRRHSKHACWTKLN